MITPQKMVVFRIKSEMRLIALKMARAEMVKKSKEKADGKHVYG